MTALEIRIIAYALMALSVIGVTAYATHKLDDARYEALQAEYAKESASAQQAAREALQAEIDKASAQDTANAKILSQLNARAASAESDALFARRLLATAKSAAGSDPVPSAKDKPGAHAAGQAGGDQSLAQDLGDAASECRIAFATLDALQEELSPQL